jgi:hypothetical protein
VTDWKPPFTEIRPVEVIAAKSDVEIATDAAPLDFLCAVYRDLTQPIGVRLRAAIEAAPYVHPKLSATAFLVPGGDFAERLERAIGRSRAAQSGGPFVIDHNPTQA